MDVISNDSLDESNQSSEDLDKNREVIAESMLIFKDEHTKIPLFIE